MDSDLVAWLRAQLDEDERAVRRIPQPYRLYASDTGRISQPLLDDDGEYQQWDDGEDCLPNYHCTWELVFDAAVALADIEAKRQLVEECAAELRRAGEDSPVGSLADFVLRTLALPYADRPGYREGWTAP